MASTNQNQKYDVFGVGNAIVDTLAFTEDAFLEKHQIAKGVMTLVEGDGQGKLLNDLQNQSLELRSGGSAANSMYNIALSGGKALYTGKVADDPNGEFYRRDLEKAGIGFHVKALSENEGPTGTCVVMTTPDSQRTMCTHLGVSTRLSAADIDEDLLKESKIVYVEGYLWTGDSTRAASIAAMEAAKKHGAKVAFTFSDPFLVNGFKDDFTKLVKDYCDIVFCNKDEAQHFTGWQDMDAVVKEIANLCELVFVTSSEEGAYVCEHKGADVHREPGFPVNAVDTNGAGDAFAGGALYGLSQGWDNAKCARWGNYLGSQIVQIHGARLQNSYESHIANIVG
ncbi:MAG: adenosine kinase [bacterium]|nr:adenosine kinase [bacterium]